MTTFVDNGGSLLHPGRIPMAHTQEGERGRAVRFIASNAKDAADAALLLSVLGLTAQEGKTR